MTTPFNYPDAQFEYRHGPQGYAHYASYRPWLRDDFTFRCVYCLVREQWGRLTGDFDLDHFVAQSKTSGDECCYEDLVYSCHHCNLLKGSRELPDPRQFFIAGQIQVHPDGRIEGLSKPAKILIRMLCLDAPRLREWRVMWMEIVELARVHREERYLQLMGFPADLPVLDDRDPPGGNSRPDGVARSFYARRLRGELPPTY